jgi:hypothetical protein
MNTYAKCGVYSGGLFSLRKEGNSDPCDNVTNPQDIVQSEISQSQKGECMMPLRVVELIEAK